MIASSVPLSQRRCSQHRNWVSPRAYSFARAGSLWVPRRRECANVTMALSPAFAHLHSGDSPMEWPGASNLVAWYHWRFDRSYNTNLVSTGTTPPVVSHSGTVPVGLGLRVEITTGGTRGTAVFRWSGDNGTNWTSGVTTAATVNLGNGVTLAFAVGTYNTDNVYILTILQLRDQTGNGHHFNTVDGAAVECPFPKVTAYGTGIGFDGADDMLQCTTGMANTMVGGTDNNFSAFIVAKVDNTSPSSGQGSLLFFGNSSTNRLVLCSFTTVPSWRILKTDDTLTSINVAGGTPNTSIHILRFVHTGTTSQIFVDGVSVVGPTSQDLGSLTGINNACIGGSFLGGAKGNKGAWTLFEMGLYSSDMDAATCADIEGRYRAPYGF